MKGRGLRKKIFHEPIWWLVVASLIVGAALGNALAHEQTSDTGRLVFGRAWRGDPSETRATLAGILGFQITIVTLIVSINAMVVKAAAYQYSPRLIPLYLRSAPVRRELPILALLAGYVLAAMRELGLVADNVVRPRAVVSVGILLVVIALALLIVDLFQTFRFVRVERVLGLVRDATFAATKRVRARIEGVRLDPRATLAQPVDAFALAAHESGYIVDVDLQYLERMAERAGVRSRISHGIGEYVEEGEVIGWVASDGHGQVDARSAQQLGRALVIDAVRDLDLDPGLGVRILVDIANRCLSSSANDPYTARQALNQLRSVLRFSRRFPLGDWNVVDHEGKVRISVAGTGLRELLAVAVGGPLYYGAKHPEVLEGLLEIVVEAGAVAGDSADRAYARSLLERVEALVDNCGMDPERVERLRAEVEPMHRALMSDSVPARGG